MRENSSQELILHIGFHKTGTCAFQSILASNSERLAKLGMYYPALGRAPNDPSHGTFANSFKSFERRMGFSKLSGADLIAELSQHCSQNVVLLSSECFLEDPEIPTAFAIDLAQRFKRVRYCAVVRNPIAWLESVHAEVVKDPYRRFAGPFELLREFRLGSYDFMQRLQPWRQALGQENEILIDYDGGEGSIISPILSALFPASADILSLLDSKSEGLVNQRLGFFATEFLRRVNMLPLTRKEHQAVVSAVMAASQTSLSTVEKKTVHYLPDHLRDRVFDWQRRSASEAGWKPAGRRPSEPSESALYHPDMFELQHQRTVLEALPREVARSIRECALGFNGLDVSTQLLRAPPAKAEDYLIATVERQRFELRRMAAELES